MARRAGIQQANNATANSSRVIPKNVSGSVVVVPKSRFLIVRVNAQPGDAVQAGQGLVVMEAMKMENELRAQAAGRVKSVLVAPGTAVEKGTLLIELEA